MAVNDPSADRSPTPADLSRRDFLRQGAATGAAFAPGIALLSSDVSAFSALASSTVEYELNVGPREADPDGRRRKIWCYNGQLPGPLVRARLGQTLRIKVTNQLAVPTSVHWHGLHQPGTWQMDGVDRVSRAPIPAGGSFVYEFVATPAGTHWYHIATSACNMETGLFGPLVIDEPAPPARYDRDEILLINDWFLPRSAEEILAGLVGPQHGRPMAGMKGPAAKSGEMKGLAMKSPAMKGAGMNGGAMTGRPMKGMDGKPDIGDVPFESALMNGRGRFAGTNAPLASVRVKPGETLRLRLINASSTYQFRFQIDGHPLTLIAADGACPIAAIKVDQSGLQPGRAVRRGSSLPIGPGAAWIRAATLAGDEAAADTCITPTPPTHSRRCLQDLGQNGTRAGFAEITGGRFARPASARGHAAAGRHHAARRVEYQRRGLSARRAHDTPRPKTNGCDSSWTIRPAWTTRFICTGTISTCWERPTG